MNSASRSDVDRARPAQADSVTSWPMAGVRWATVTRSRRIQPASHPGAPIWSGSGTTIVAPTDSGQNMSRWIGSWARPDSIEKRSSAVTPNRSLCHGRKWVREPWRPSTAFGSPVEPDVNVRQAGLSAPMASVMARQLPGGHGSSAGHGSRSASAVAG